MLTIGGNAMGELKKLTPQQLEELRQQLKSEKKMMEREENRSVCDELKKRITVTVSDDKMSAFITLHNPGEESSYSKEEIVSELRKNKVVLGYREDILDRLAAGEWYDVETQIAYGKSVIQGCDGYYEFNFSTNSRKEPVIREDGTADYSAMGRLENVKEGFVIAKYIPAVQGKKGFTVTGAELIPKYAKDLPVLRGKNILKNNDTNEYTATKSGKISYSNGNIEILTVHEINDDVDLITGTIEFYGDVVINGNVEAGVVIRSGRNVTITGTVSAAKIFAGGDVILSKGIQGGAKGKISARGSVYADFIEYAEVDAMADVNANSIINSKINAVGKVILKGKRGSLIGGFTHALKGIQINSSGNLSEAKTILHSGTKEEDYLELSKLLSQERRMKQALVLVVEKMTEILQLKKNNQGVFTIKQKEILFQLNTQKDDYYKKIDELNKDKQELTKRMSLGQGTNITIKRDVHRGTIISIDTAILSIVKDECYVRFICKNSAIERTSIPQE